MALYEIQIHLITYLDTYIRNQMEKNQIDTNNKTFLAQSEFWQEQNQKPTSGKVGPI